MARTGARSARTEVSRKCMLGASSASCFEEDDRCGFGRTTSASAHVQCCSGKRPVGSAEALFQRPLWSSGESGQIYCGGTGLEDVDSLSAKQTSQKRECNGEQATEPLAETWLQSQDARKFEETVWEKHYFELAHVRVVRRRGVKEHHPPPISFGDLQLTASFFERPVTPW